MNFRRRERWKSGWGKSLLRTALLYAGGTALIAWVVMLSIAVFAEPDTGAASGTWLAVAMIVSFIGIGLTLTIMVTNPGWRTGVTGAIVAVACAIGGALVLSAMPDPSAGQYISHRLAVAALGFGFGVVGGGLLVLGEMATDGKVPTPPWQPSPDVSLRFGVSAAAVVVLAGGAGVPVMHEWADAANTDASYSTAPPPKSVDLDLADTKLAGTSASGGLGTPNGLLTMDYGGDDAPTAVTMHDTGTGAQRWHHRVWNRVSTGEPVLSSDGSQVAVPGKRIDSDTRHTLVLDTATGRTLTDIKVDHDLGKLTALTNDAAIYVTGATSNTATARDHNGSVKWSYTVPNDCVLSTMDDTANRVFLSLACRSDTGTKDHTKILAVDASTGKRVWKWEAKATGGVYENGMVVTPDALIVDVRNDKSTSDAIFAARKYRHDLTSISLSDGSQNWRRANKNLGDTFAPACAGTLQLAGTDPKKGRVVLGECHQITGTAGAVFDVRAYSLKDGKRKYRGDIDLGFAPDRSDDTSKWFAGLPDGRTVLTTDASLDLNEPECRIYSAGPKSDSELTRLPFPDELKKSDWCRKASIHVTPNSLAVTYPTDKAADGRYFAVGPSRER